MDSEYRRWLDERKHRETMARGIQAPTPPPRPSIATAVGVPVLQAIAIGGAVGLLAGGLPALFGTPPLLAAKLAVAGMMVGTAGATVLFIVQERRVHTSPTRLSWERLRMAEPGTPPPEPDDSEPWRVINRYRPRAPMITASATRMDATAAPVEPDARPEVKRLHDFICSNWGRDGRGNLSRDACRKRGFTRSVWEKYVGGKRGRTGESAKGLLDRAGVVEKTAAGWQWRDGVTLQDVFNVQAELASYADARAKMVQGRRDRTGRTGQDTPGSTSRGSQPRKGGV